MYILKGTEALDTPFFELINLTRFACLIFHTTGQQTTGRHNIDLLFLCFPMIPRNYFLVLMEGEKNTTGM